jgi:hypothetical protein
MKNAIKNYFKHMIGGEGGVERLRHMYIFIKLL